MKFGEETLTIIRVENGYVIQWKNSVLEGSEIVDNKNGLMQRVDKLISRCP